jgi:hypothetical protein
VVTVVVWGRLLFIGLGVLLTRGPLVETIIDIEDGQILVHLSEEHSLDLHKQLFTVLTDETVVIFVFHVHNKVKIIFDCGTGECSNCVDLDRALKFFLLYVGQSVCRQKKITLLLKTEPVEFEYLRAVHK